MRWQGVIRPQRDAGSLDWSRERYWMYLAEDLAVGTYGLNPPPSAVISERTIGGVTYQADEGEAGDLRP